MMSELPPRNVRTGLAVNASAARSRLSLVVGVLVLALAAYSLGRICGGVLGITTATVRQDRGSTCLKAATGCTSSQATQERSTWA